MLRSQLATFVARSLYHVKSKRLVTTLSPRRITELLTKNEVTLAKNALPSYIKSIECNQLASNNPIEDRVRVSSLRLPGSREPTLIMGVFDGHGGGTTADLITKRLFNYIALSLYPEPDKLKISDKGELRNLVNDLHSSPKLDDDTILLEAELESLNRYKNELSNTSDIAAILKASFRRCDDDLSREIQENLTNWRSSQNTLHHYLSAAVSGCCAIVMVVHNGMGYLASTGDCRAALGIHEKVNHQQDTAKETIRTQKTPPNHNFSAVELNDEHNCDNINEIRRLASAHPKSEQNTMIKHNRLLGHLMPFRAFGDFNYKWSAEVIKSCGITRAFGPNVIPSHYNTPPYLIVEPDVTELKIEDQDEKNFDSCERQRYLVIASDGLWEMFESSREVIETIVDHSMNASQQADDYDRNCATHILRSALRSGSQQDFGSDTEELRKLYHIRLESTLTLPQAIVRNFRDDISIVLLNL